MGVASVLGIPAAAVGTEVVREGGMQMGPQGVGGERGGSKERAAGPGPGSAL